MATTLDISFKTEGEDAWSDLNREDVTFIEGTELRMTGLPDGAVDVMGNKRPSVAFLVRIGENEYVMVETTLRLLKLATDAFMAKYGYLT